MKKTTILLADTSPTFNQNVKKFLDARDFKCFVADDGIEALRIIYTAKPALILVDLLLPKLNAISLLQQIRKKDPEILSSCKFLVASNQNSIDNIRECLRLGASDYLLKPIEMDEFIARLAFHLHSQKNTQEVTPNTRDTSRLYLYLLELVLRAAQQSTDSANLFARVTQMAAMAVKGVRVSIIQCTPYSERAVVRASSDDTRKTDWPIDLRKYPEITFVINTGKTVAIENIDADEQLAKIKSYLKDIQFNSLIVAPILQGNDLYGVLSCRLPPDRNKIDDDEIRFIQLLAEIIGLTLKAQKMGDQKN